MFVVRHKFRFLDFAAVGLAVLLVLYIALVANIFTDIEQQHAPDTLEIDELILISTVLVLGFLWAMRRLIRERKDGERRAAVEREIRTLAFHDALTGLPNRRQFDDALKAAAAAPPRSGASHGVFMLDLNGFKRVNDIFGHAAGDEVLINIGARLTRAVRFGDMVARLGGDEFAILATQLSGPEAATSVALRIMEELQEPVVAAGREHAIASAIGIALTPQDSRDPAELMRMADIALYRAKEQGRSAMRFFEPEMDTHARERDDLERALREAVTTDAIVPMYQPLVDLKTGKVREFEALARWVDPVLGEVPPERFIPIAEDSGLIAEMTDRLLIHACMDAKNWPADVQLSFNISPVLLRDPGFGLRLLSLLGRTGFPPYRLEIEITESALVRDLDAAQKALGGLREVGIKIALDDFGTGYSSLYHLRNFKLDKIKIDRSFVGEMTSNRESEAIVRALVGLGSGLGLEVTAEGVETEEQKRLLSDQGCGQAQGFLYSEAISAEGALAMLGHRQREIAASCERPSGRHA